MITKVKKLHWLIGFIAFISMHQLLSDALYSLQQCYIDKLAEASDAMTLGELREYCASRVIPILEAEAGAVNENLTIAKKHSAKQRLSFSPHKSNYLLPISYNSTPNPDSYSRSLTEEYIHNFEIIFQMSSKMRIVDNLFGDNGDLYGAYTGRFWWQAYNNDISSPFRETNHEPELFLDFESDYQWGEWSLTNVIYGMAHQSNGRALPSSRSWNRLYMELKFRNKDAWINFKPWFHVPESTKDNAADPRGDDNPDIDQYMGYFEFTAGYDFGRNHLVSMFRNNLRPNNKGAFQLDVTFPIADSTDVRGYFQYFTGYGESLIDYDVSTNRLSLGFIMSEY